MEQLKCNLEQKRFIANSALATYELGGIENLNRFIEWWQSYGIAIRPRKNNAGLIVGMYCQNYVI